jgi:hypothetical protein
VSGNLVEARDRADGGPKDAQVREVGEMLEAGGDRGDAPDVATDASLDRPGDLMSDATGEKADGSPADVSDDRMDDVPADVADDRMDDVPAEVGDASSADRLEDMAGEASSDGGSGEDGNPGPCDPNDLFGPPVLVPGLNGISANVVTAQFSPDELTAYFGMPHGEQLDIYTATRPSRFDSFPTAAPLSAVNSLATDVCPSVTADGLTLYITSTRSGVYALFVSSRETTSTDFSTPSELTNLDVYGEGNPFVTPDGGALYFHSYRNGNYDVLRAKKTGIGFEPPELLGFDTNFDEAAPVVSADDLTIYYLSTGNPGGSDGVWMATRQSIDQPFSAGMPVTGLTGKDPPVQPLWLSPDGCRLYIQDRDANSGYLVSVVERSPPRRQDR